MKIYELLNFARRKLVKVTPDKETAYREAGELLLHTLNISREKLFVIFRDEVNETTKKRFLRFVRMRLDRIPVQYITGLETFHGRVFAVSKNVFIPRPDSEALIDAAKSASKKLKKGFLTADSGAGTGALGLTLAMEIKKAGRVYLIDKSKSACACSAANAKLYGITKKAVVVRSDCFGFLKNNGRKISLIICNPPYIRKRDINSLQEEVKREPLSALTDGGDGLSFYRKFAANGKSFIRKGGFLIVEIGDDTEKDVLDIFKGTGWKYINSTKDFRGKIRAITLQFKI